LNNNKKKGIDMSGYAVKTTESSKLRARLDHPVIDGDAHIIECAFVLPDFLKQVGGPDLVKRFDKAMKNSRPGDANPISGRPIPANTPSTA
jgi:hypothetical protein